MSKKHLNWMAFGIGILTIRSAHKFSSENNLHPILIKRNSFFTLENPTLFS